jgi:hypothetical protein
MAGTHPFLRKLRSLLKVLDDEALASLANKGLLRRAQKDLEAASPILLAVEDGRVQLKVADATVDARELPAKCTCSCPATGICRHILGGLLYLRDSSDLADCDGPVQAALFAGDATDAKSPEAAETLADPPSPADVLGNLTDQELQKWAGKTLLRKAIKVLAANLPVEIDAAQVLTVRFPTRNITCRWLPSSGLAGMICSCQSQSVCEHAAAAILAYQVSLGRRQITVEQATLTESSGAPRSRAEVLASVGTVLREMLSLGLTRLSAATAQRLMTLAVSAHGVDLPRLERMLKTLADEVQLALRRDAQANAANLITQAARVEALRTALTKSASSALVGRHRSQYHDVGQITLVGLGAQQWRSKGGYRGVTVYFWDESQNNWATWSDARPVTQPGFAAAARFRSDGPWDGCRSPQEAAQNVLRVSQASRNPHGRLSGRPATRALVVGPSQPRDVPCAISTWTELAERARQLFGVGLSEYSENKELVFLLPKAWGPAFYDTLRQELVLPVTDAAGRVVNLWLPFTPENETGVAHLERLDPAPVFGLLGAIRLVAGQVCVQPISLFVEDRIVHLTLLDPHGAPAGPKPNKKRKAMTASSPPQQESDEEEIVAGDEEVSVPQLTVASATGRILVTVQAELEALVECGIAVRRNLDLLRAAAKQLDAIGLTACARPLAAALQALETAAQRSEPGVWNDAAGRLLHAYYVTRLAADFEMIDIACRGLK